MKPYTKEDILKAIKGSNGIISLVTQKLGQLTGDPCGWHCAAKWIKKWKCTEKALKDEKYLGIDFAKSKLFALIKDRDFRAIKFHLENNDPDYMKKSMHAIIGTGGKLSPDAEKRLNDVFKRTVIDTYADPVDDADESLGDQPDVRPGGIEEQIADEEEFDQ